MQYEIQRGDCIARMRATPDNTYDSIVCDPPYELGFMGKAWDGSGIAYSVEMWREALRVLKPGGHLLAFSGSRTYHRMACAIEDAGFEVRDRFLDLCGPATKYGPLWDSLNDAQRGALAELLNDQLGLGSEMAWTYGSGFPKSLDVSKAIDKAAGAVREVLAEGKAVKRMIPGADQNATSSWIKDNGREYVPTETAPATDAARQWEGWGTALKPAHEPICVARKPLASLGTNVLNMVELQLRARGVTGDIEWKLENANGAKSKKARPSSCAMQVPQVAATSAASVAASGTLSDERRTPSSSVPHGVDGPLITPVESRPTGSGTATSCATRCSRPTAENVHAAASSNATSSLSTTSTGVGQRTGKRSTEKCTPNFDAPDSPMDTACFAGIATGLPGSMATVRITRDENGAFLWPAGLPKAAPGGPLTVAANVLAHGTGALNIDGCRVGTSKDVPASVGSKRERDGWAMQTPDAESSGFNPNVGRWPANLIHDGSDEVLALFPVTTSGANPTRRGGMGFHGANGQDECAAPRGAESGSAARFFYCAKASKSDRGPSNTHPTVKPLALMQYLVRLVTPPGGHVLDPFAGSGSTIVAALREGFRATGIELLDEHAAIIEGRMDEELYGDIL